MQPLKNTSNVNSIRMSSHGTEDKFQTEGIQYTILGASLMGVIIGIVIGNQ